MENNKKSFILHLDSLCVLDDMNFEQKGILIDAIYKFHLGAEVDLDFGMKMAFAPFKNQFIRDNEKYSEFSQKQSFNGKKGGRPKKTEENPKNPSLLEKPKKAYNDNVSDSVNDNVNDSENENESIFLLEKETKKNNTVFDFKNALIDYGFEKNLVDDWLKVRKTKKATNTETAFKAFIHEIESKNCNINEMLQLAVTNSWSGFKHTWAENLKNNNQNITSTRSNAEIFNTAMQSEAAKNFRFGKQQARFSTAEALEAIAKNTE